MKDQSRELLAIRSMLSSTIERIDLLALEDDEVPRSDDEREIVAVCAMLAATYLPRSKADVLHFARAVLAGDDAWLIVHSLPGEHRADAAYHAHLNPATRHALEG